MPKKKKKQLLAGISRVPSSHMAERCLISNQANGNKMVRGNAEGTHSITQDSTLYTSPKKKRGSLLTIFLTACKIEMLDIEHLGRKNAENKDINVQAMRTLWYLFVLLCKPTAPKGWGCC